MVKQCVVYGCSNNHKTHHSFHKFPLDPSNRLEWTRFVQMRRLDFTEPAPFSVICSAHFKPECYNTVREGILREMEEKIIIRKLLPGSVPTIQSTTEIGSKRGFKYWESRGLLAPLRSVANSKMATKREATTNLQDVLLSTKKHPDLIKTVGSKQREIRMAIARRKNKQTKTVKTGTTSKDNASQPHSTDEPGTAHVSPCSIDKPGTVHRSFGSTEKPGAVHVSPYSMDEPETVLVAPCATDKLGTVQEAPCSTTKPGTVQGSSCFTDRLGPVQVSTCSIDKARTVQVSPYLRDEPGTSSHSKENPGTVKVLPCSIDKLVPVQVTPYPIDKPGTANLLPSCSTDKPGTLYLLPFPTNNPESIQVSSHFTDKPGTVHVLPYSTNKPGTVQAHCQSVQTDEYVYGQLEMLSMIADGKKVQHSLSEEKNNLQQRLDTAQVEIAALKDRVKILELEAELRRVKSELKAVQETNSARVSFSEPTGSPPAASQGLKRRLDRLPIPANNQRHKGHSDKPQAITTMSAKRKLSREKFEKKIRKRSFVSKWKVDFPGLENTSGGMICSICCKHKDLADQSSKFLTGQQNYRIAVVKSHFSTLKHTRCVTEDARILKNFPRWKDEFPGLQDTSEGMICSICCKHKDLADNSSKCVTGQKSYKRAKIQSHFLTQKHKLCAGAELVQMHIVQGQCAGPTVLQGQRSGPMDPKEQCRGPTELEGQCVSPIEPNKGCASPIEPNKGCASSIESQEVYAGLFDQKGQCIGRIEFQEERIGPIEPKEECTGPIEPKEELTGPIDPYEQCASPIEPQGEFSGPIFPQVQCTGLIEPKQECASPIEPHEECDSLIEPKEQCTGPIELQKKCIDPVDLQEHCTGPLEQQGQCEVPIEPQEQCRMSSRGRRIYSKHRY